MPKISQRFPLKFASVIWRGEIDDEDRAAFTAVFVPMPDSAWETLKQLVERYAHDLNLYQGVTIKVATERLDRLRKAVTALQEAMTDANTPDINCAATALVGAHWQDGRETEAIEIQDVARVVQENLEMSVEGETGPIADSIAHSLWPWIAAPLSIKDFEVMIQRYHDAVVAIMRKPGLARDPHADFLLRLHSWAGEHGLKNGVSETNPGPLIRLAQKVRASIPKEVRPPVVKDNSLASQLDKLLKASTGDNIASGDGL